MKIEWLVTDVTAIGSPGRAESAILGVVLAERVLAVQDIFRVTKALHDVECSS